VLKLTDSTPLLMSASSKKAESDQEAVSSFDIRKWGLQPQDILGQLIQKEWRHSANLKSRLLGTRGFPLKINLKVPDGKMAVNDLKHFQGYIESWKSYPNQKFIEWELKPYRVLCEQRIPRTFILHNFQDLILAIGKKAEERSQLWKVNMAPLLQLHGGHIYPVLVKHLSTIEEITLNESILLKSLVGQLSPNMGAGAYLRALPIEGVDTKFLENHQSLISDLLDAIHDGDISRKGGLLEWLGCLENPKGWVCVRPLCSNSETKMGGLPIMQLSIDVLKRYQLPANNILVVENMQSGLALPRLKDTIAVFGGGKNVAWMEANWLKSKRVAYWGDIDTWGFSILSDVRTKLCTVTSLMMDLETIKAFEERMVVEPEPFDSCPAELEDSEREIFFGLKSGRFRSSRLEQERLSPDYILQRIHEWLS